MGFNSGFKGLIHSHGRGAPFLASNVVIVTNDNKFMFRSLTSNFAYIAQEMWEVLFELYPIVINSGEDTSKISVTSQKKARPFNAFF